MNSTRKTKKGPLTGITYTATNTLMRKGERKGKLFTAGLEMLDGFRSPITATSIQRLDNAGATYEGPDASTSILPDTTTFVLYTDSDGSIAKIIPYRHPIIVRPTFGAISRFGVSSTVSSTDVICYLADDLDNAKLVLSTLSGQDPLDPTTIPENIYELDPNPIKTLGTIKTQPINPRYNIKTDLEANGITEITEITLPHIEHSIAVYRTIMSAEVMSNYMRFDGIRYGTSVRTDNGSLTELYGKSRAQGLSKEIQQNILLGNYVLENANFEKYYVKAAKARALIIKDFAKAFEQVDVIIAPSTSDEFLTAVALAGLPMVSLPSGISHVGRRKEDVALLNFAHSFAGKESGSPQKAPEEPKSKGAK